MKQEIINILRQFEQRDYKKGGVSLAPEMYDAVAEKLVKLFCQPAVSGSLRFSEREVDFAYLCGVFNTSGIDGLHNEIQRLKELGKEPHDIIEVCRKQ